MGNVEYKKFTYESSNPLARFSHRTRFAKAVNTVSCIYEKWAKGGGIGNFALLDYGAGTGHFLNELLKNGWGQGGRKLVGFDPVSTPDFSGDSIVFYSDLQSLDDQFDIVTCFEVLEHFNSKNQREILTNIDSLLKRNGRVVISVPIEIYLPSIVKNVRRRLSLHRRKPVYTLKNMFKALCGRDIPEIREAEGFLPHIGFNHKKLEQLFSDIFQIERKSYSPFGCLNAHFNSQIFYVLKKMRFRSE